MKRCPYCAEEIQDEAIYCRYCSHDLRVPIAPGSDSETATRPHSTAPTGTEHIPEKTRKERGPHEWKAGQLVLLGYGLMALPIVQSVYRKGFISAEDVGQYLTGGLVWGWVFSLIVVLSRRFRNVPPRLSTRWIVRLLWVLPVCLVLFFLSLWIVPAASSVIQSSFLVEPTRTPLSSPRSTPSSTARRPVPTSPVVLRDLVSRGYLTAENGTFLSVSNYDASWARLNSWDMWRTGYSPSSFVAIADATWESASLNADWPGSGCGFIFRETPSETYGPTGYTLYLGLNGTAYLVGYNRGQFRLEGQGRYGSVDVPVGSARLMLIVEGRKLRFLVNDTSVIIRDDLAIDEGNLGLTVLSGTTEGYGTRCKMRNIQLWELPRSE